MDFASWCILFSSLFLSFHLFLSLFISVESRRDYPLKLPLLVEEEEEDPRTVQKHIIQAIPASLQRNILATTFKLCGVCSTSNLNLAIMTLQGCGPFLNVTTLVITWNIWLEDHHLPQFFSLFPNIIALNLYECPNISEIGFNLISNLGIQKFTAGGHLQVDNITDNTLDGFKKLPLRYLSLQNCNGITNAGVKHLCHQVHLTHLDLSFCKDIKDTGLISTPIRKLPGLVYLGVPRYSTLPTAERSGLCVTSLPPVIERDYKFLCGFV
jgi:hypothetical protein